LNFLELEYFCVYLIIDTLAGPRIHTQQALTIQKPRTKATITASLSPARLPGHKTPITVSRHGVVLPVPVEPASPGIATARTGVHVKQEGGKLLLQRHNIC